jgi:predicted  nucleic acid-binding Zn-ribbon protein
MADNIYLTDEFVAFSQKIAEIYAAKKAKKDEMKAVFAKFEEELKKFDTEAATLQQHWDRFAANHAKK